MCGKKSIMRMRFRGALLAVGTAAGLSLLGASATLGSSVARAVALGAAPSPEDAATTTIRWLSPGKYQLEVGNTSDIGFIDTFLWVPPPGMTITAITSSEAARCALAGGQISCTTRLAPPACTCETGGTMTVNFTAVGIQPTYANGYWTSYGVEGAYLQIEAMTTVPYHIPSFISGPNT